MSQLSFGFNSIKDHEIFRDLAPHIVKSFWKYHTDNPHVFTLFSKYAYELKSKGRKHYGVGVITERIRWHIAVETTGDDFKINNNYRSCYARLLIIHDRSFADFFQTRRSPGTVKIQKGDAA